MLIYVTYITKHIYVYIYTLWASLVMSSVIWVEKDEQRSISRVLHPSLGIAAGSISSFPCNQQMLAQNQTMSLLSALPRHDGYGYPQIYF